MSRRGRERAPVTQFLNRVLALTIDLQNLLFEVFDGLMTARVEGAVAAGTYDLGLETVTAESLAIVERLTVYTHPATGAETQAFTIARRDRNTPLTLDIALERAAEPITLSPRLGDYNEDLRLCGVDALRFRLRVQVAPEDVARFMMVYAVGPGPERG